jgi:hypothetical protein
MGVSEEAHAIVSKDVADEHGYSVNFVKAIHSTMFPGASLDALNKASVEVVLAAFKKLKAKGRTTVGLFDWSRHEVMMATSEGVWGPQNPLRDAAVEENW